MNIQFDTTDKYTVIHYMESRMDAVSAPDFIEIVKQRIGEGENNLIIDMLQVEFIDSSSLGAIVSILKSIGSDGQLVLSSVSGSVRELFRITRMDQVINIVDDTQTAINVIS